MQERARQKEIDEMLFSEAEAARAAEVVANAALQKEMMELQVIVCVVITEYIFIDVLIDRRCYVQLC